jgi:hypothetical protein
MSLTGKSKAPAIQKGTRNGYRDEIGFFRQCSPEGRNIKNEIWENAAVALDFSA